MIETVAAGLLIYLGQKIIDKFWTQNRAGYTAAVSSFGQLQYTTPQDGRTVISKELTVPQYQEYELVFGDFYLPDTIHDILIGEEIPLVLIVEETKQQAYLFNADLDYGYEVYLPHGYYSFYVFLVDSSIDNFFDALIWAVGFPSNIDLSNIDRIQLDNHDYIWNFIDDSPLEVGRRGPYYLDFIFIDTDEVPGFPTYFSDLYSSQV